MALIADYTAGTVSSSGAVITGNGTGWVAALFQEGDIFIAEGWWAVVSSVDSNTQITLVDWAGPALIGSTYRLRYMSDGSRTSAQARQLIDMLGGSGNIEALSGLTGLPGMIPVFTGPGAMELRPFAAGLQPAGEWDVATVYKIGDLVTYLGNAFGSIIDNNQGNTPPATADSDANWQYFPTVPGEQGPPGPSAPLTIGTVTQGTTAAASITGTVPNQQLNLTLPRGQQGTPGIQGDIGPQGNPGPANSLSIGTVSGGSTAGATITGSAPTQTLNLILPKGDTGDSVQGWTPVLALIVDGARVVQQVVDWVGGDGIKPTTGEYVGATGLVTDIVDAVNIRGASGSGTGDMQASTYDPNNIANDAFARENHTGTQAISTVTGLQTALNGKFAQPTGAISEYLRGDGTPALFPAIPPGTVTSVGLTVPTGFSAGSAVTSSGNLSFSYAAGYSIPTTTKQGQWDTAYGWGNHASAGYLTTVAAAAAYQPLNSNLTTLAGLAATTNNFMVAVSSAWASRTPAQVRTTLALDIGTDVQAYSAKLTSLAAQTWATDRFTYYTDANTPAIGTITAAGRALIDDADVAAQRTTLGVKSGATRDVTISSSAPSGGADGDIWFRV